MEQSVFIPTSPCNNNNNNKSLNTQAVTKPDHPKYQVAQNSMYEIDSLIKIINKKLFGKAESLAYKILSFLRTKLSNSQTLILDGVETGVLLSDFAQQLRRKNADVPDLYFTLLVAAGISSTLVLNQNAKTKEEGSWVRFKIRMSKVAKVVYLGRCCLWSLRILVKTSNLPVSKVRPFSQSKLSYPKLTLATRKIKGMKAITRFKNEIWCRDLAYVDKLPTDSNGVKCLLVRQNLFDRTVESKGLKTKDSKEMFRLFLTMITRNI